MIIMMFNRFLEILGKESAYLDPGSGSFLLQLLIAGALGLAVAVRASWSKIKKLFKRGNKDDDEELDQDE